MKRKLILGILLCSIFTGCSYSSPNQIDPSVDMSVREIVLNTDNIKDVLSQAKSAVVGISTSLANGYAVGSGVAISQGGYILTNFHVIEGGRDITLYFADKTIGSANVVWGDSSMDLAVLKSSKEIPYLSTIKLDNLYVGQDVYAIGTPLTLEFKHTITKGIVSAMDRTLESESSYGVSYLQSLVQHDASINPGNSGGPLIDSHGRVIGINTLKATEGEGIGFAVPIELGEVIINKIIENENFEAPYLGIFAFDSELAQVNNVQTFGNGIYVVSTKDNALNAGLKKGDIITQVDDKEIKNMLDFKVAIYSKNIGEKINITYLRNGELRNTEILLSVRK